MTIQKEDEQRSKRRQLEDGLRKNLYKNKKNPDVEKENVQQDGKEEDKKKVKKRKPVVAGPIDALEQDFSVLDETQFREVTYILSDDEPDATVTPTPLPPTP